MEFFMIFIIILSLCSSESKKSNKVQNRLNRLKSRVVRLESRINLESSNIRDISDSVTNINSSLHEHKAVCKKLYGHGSTHEEKEDTEPTLTGSLQETEARVLTAFKQEKFEIRDTMNKIEEKLVKLHENSSRKAEVERHAAIDDYNELKKVVEKLNISLVEKQAELTSKLETLATAATVNYNKIRNAVENINMSVIEKQWEITRQLDVLTTTTGILSRRLLECPDLWSRLDLFCYRVFQTSVNYTDAKRLCRESGAYVVEVLSQEEADFVTSLVGTSNYWIGLTDIEKEGTWKWDRTKSQASFLNWRPGQPNSVGGNEDCAVAGYGSPYDKWDDIMCSSRWLYVCKKSI